MKPNLFWSSIQKLLTSYLNSVSIYFIQQCKTDKIPSLMELVSYSQEWVGVWINKTSTNRFWVVISTKKKNKAWVRCGCIGLLQKASLIKWAETLWLCVPAVGIAGARALRRVWTLRTVQQWGGQCDWSGVSKKDGQKFRSGDIQVGARSSRLF